MRAATLASLALSTLALFASANPEPCSDHPGVVHAPGEYGTVVKNVAKVAKLKSSSSSSKSRPKSSGSKASSSKTVQKAAAVKASTPKKSTSSSSSSGKSASKSTSSAPSKFSTKPVKKKATPKVKDSTPETVASGASKAISGFTNSSLIDPAAAKALEQAVSSAVNKQVSQATTVTLTQTSVVLSTETANVTRTETVANSTIFVPQPTTFVRTLTQNVTQVATSTLITTSDAVAASLDIQKALDEAFAAANLSKDSLDAETTASLEACLTAVLASGGMPDGYSCLTSSGSSSEGLQATLNTVLEQFVGILPNKILEAVFDSVTPLLTTLLPASEQALVAQIQSSIQSVIASLSGNSVTALEQVSQCYSDAIQQQGNVSALACFTADGGAYDTLQTATNGVLEQFVGVLPASLTTMVANIFAYNLGNETTPSDQLASSVSAQISNAINSVASSLSGNTVTLAEVLQACAAELIKTGNATAAAECITQTSAPEISMTTIQSIEQQFLGYLPSSFFTDLVDYSSTLLNTSSNAHNLTQSEVNASLESFFNNATAAYGPAYVTCLAEVQACVTNAVTKSGTIDAVCAGPVDGCATPKADAQRMGRRHKRSQKSHFGFAGRIRDVTFWRA
ncbi:hypothetical protein JCM10207_006503 [Rhodosporidiobolus poonsookiae]